MARDFKGLRQALDSLLNKVEATGARIEQFGTARNLLSGISKFDIGIFEAIAFDGDFSAFSDRRR